MFDVDFRGLAELEGGKLPLRLAFEPVANVFDEARGYNDRAKPGTCRVTLDYSHDAPRGVWLRVEDDGPGFERIEDVWTLFGSTAKRDAPGVAGRFNMGEKQLIAVARQARIVTAGTEVRFEDGERRARKLTGEHSGTLVEVLMAWSLQDMRDVRAGLENVIPPEGLTYLVGSQGGQMVEIDRPGVKVHARVNLPTVRMADGVLRDTTRVCMVEVLDPKLFADPNPRLYELGIPVCDLTDLGFPWSLNVGQKIPLPTSRDTVSPAYLFRLIGSVVEFAAMDGTALLTPEQEGAGFIKAALDWVRDPRALRVVVEGIYGANAVRVSSDPIANAQAAAAGAPIISGRTFSPDTLRRMNDARAIPTSKQVYGGTPAEPPPPVDSTRCQLCGRPFDAGQA